MGAATEVEQKARQHKTEDALSATRAAVEEGVVPGGGIALSVTAGVFTKLQEVRAKSEEIANGVIAGEYIVRNACEAPLRQIIKNAGKDDTTVLYQISEARKKDGAWAIGYNAQTNEIQDLIKAGIMDPTKVVRSALQNAASAASMFLTIECVVAELPEKEEKSKMPPMPEEY